MLLQMINTIKEKIIKLENPIKKLMKSGFIFSFQLCILATIILATYDFFYTAPNLYYIGISLFKSSLMFFAYIIICGFAFDTIKKQTT